MQTVHKISLLSIGFFSTAIFPASAGDIEVPFKLTDSNHIVVELEINGQGPFEFVVDTGASGTVIYPSLAETLKLAEANRGPQSGSMMRRRPSSGEGNRAGSLRGAAGETPVLAQMKTYSLGSVSVNGIPLGTVPVAPSIPQRDEEGWDLQGILGADILSNYAVFFDYQTNTLRFMEEVPEMTSSWEEVTVNFRGSLPFLTGTIKETKATIFLDTGAARTIINEKALNAFGLEKDNPGLEEDEPILGASQVAAGPAFRVDGFSISLGGADYDPAHTTFSELPLFKMLAPGDDPFVILGDNFLRQRPFVLDYENRKIFIGPKLEAPDRKNRA